MKQKALWLFYTELADYAVNCINLLAEHYDVTLIHWPINPEAPFQFEFHNSISVYNRAGLSVDSMKKMLLDDSPEAVLVSGWMDKGYLKTINNLPNLKTRIIMMDTAWVGNLKQKVGLFALKPIIKGLFTHAFVSGEKQMEYAQKLGFESQNISKGLYAASLESFNRIYEEKSNLPPAKKVLYVGRYVKHKGIFELWEAFAELVDSRLPSEGFADWELVCVGTGDMWEQRMEHPNIKHMGFVQPKQLKPILMESAIYVLPSHYEPWGVSVHEMAAAGFPLIISDAVGSKEVFLEEGKNGFLFPAKNKTALKFALLEMMNKSEKELQKMGHTSHQLAQQITPQTWVETVTQIINKPKRFY